MNLSNLQLEASGYIFEKANGISHSEQIEKMILDSEISPIGAKELENMIVESVESGKMNDPNTRSNAYWALSKRINKHLIHNFRK